VKNDLHRVVVLQYKKPKVKKRVAQPAKGIIERTICAHPMLKRVQKEVRELKKKSVKKY